ncbi:MAG: YHS domain-containing protein [Chitinophagaceae bacterium]
MRTEKYIAILMADLSGYTAMTEVHGPSQAMCIVDKFVGLAKKSLFGKSRLFERIGDQVVIISENADDLARTAVTLNNIAQKEPYFLPVHSGMHYGSVLEQHGRIYGSTINIAARIASEARNGSMLASFDFISALTYPKAFQYEMYGIPHFKNVLNPTTLFKIIPATTTLSPVFSIDPVCHMQLRENEKGYNFRVDGKRYQFCSHQCLDLFTVNQAHFLKQVNTI